MSGPRLELRTNGRLAASVHAACVPILSTTEQGSVTEDRWNPMSSLFTRIDKNGGGQVVFPRDIHMSNSPRTGTFHHEVKQYLSGTSGPLPLPPMSFIHISKPVAPTEPERRGGNFPARLGMRTQVCTVLLRWVLFTSSPSSPLNPTHWRDLISQTPYLPSLRPVRSGNAEHRLLFLLLLDQALEERLHRARRLLGVALLVVLVVDIGTAVLCQQRVPNP